jgi:hypothetical protein
VRREKKQGGRKAREGQKHDKWETRGWASNCTHSSCILCPIDGACRVSAGWRGDCFLFSGLNKTDAHRGISRRSHKADGLSSASISTVWDTLERRNAAVKGPASDEAQSGLRWSSPSLEVSLVPISIPALQGCCYAGRLVEEQQSALDKGKRLSRPKNQAKKVRSPISLPDPLKWFF